MELNLKKISDLNSQVKYLWGSQIGFSNDLFKQNTHF